MRLRRVMMTLVAATALAACGPDIPDPNGGNGNGNGEQLEATWPTVSETFEQNCVQCHAGATAPEGLDLSGDAAYDNIVEVASAQVPGLNLVEPGDPASSYLYLKVSELHADACIDEGLPPENCGARMPHAGAALPAARILAIHDWIAEGALREE